MITKVTIDVDNEKLVEINDYGGSVLVEVFSRSVPGSSEEYFYRNDLPGDVLEIINLTRKLMLDRPRGD